MTGILRSGPAMASLLLVDDESCVLNALRRTCLARSTLPAIPDPSVTTLASPLEAIAYLQDHPVDVVVADFRMPVMDGAAFLTRVKAMRPDTARIILSASADVDAIARAIDDAGGVRFVSKPCDDRELKAAIVGALAYRQLHLENRRLAREVRELRNTIARQQRSLERLESDSPGVARARRREEGGVTLHES